ncbi:general stress protein [Cohnella nanjingensis]|uniref:General stress protein n=1 Tax=Cohnella nanjingensis TaxID=1387779 RepID=A0A7X0RTB9_9BACL|nr:general stress protein [Cohnella nanjingensis]MBB6672106.1 general stress protein [Cohnella nanjingensis]
MANHKKIVGVFTTEQEAIRAIEGLKRQGYTSDDISVVGKNKDDIYGVTNETGTKAPEGATAGAATGGVVGGATGLLASLGLLAIPGIGPILAAGPIAATLAGLAVGAGTGGIVGGLIGTGIPADEAKQYDAYVKDGRILVLVDSRADHDTAFDARADRDRDVYDTFRDNRSLNANYYDRV